MRLQTVFLECIRHSLGPEQQRISEAASSGAILKLLRCAVKQEKLSQAARRQIGIWRVQSSIAAELNADPKTEDDFAQGCAAVTAEVTRVMQECAADSTHPEAVWQDAVLKWLQCAYEGSQGVCLSHTWQVFKAVGGKLRGSSWLSAEDKKRIDGWISTMRARQQPTGS